jgi:hypothetical protein
MDNTINKPNEEHNIQNDKTDDNTKIIDDTVNEFWTQRLKYICKHCETPRRKCLGKKITKSIYAPTENH